MSPLALPVSMICVGIGKVPWWLNTPDDPHSPHGQYEEAVKAIYERYGNYVGDVYWLGIRNSFYGLAYWFKPDFLKDLDTYKNTPTIKILKKNGWEIRLIGTEFYERVRVFGPFQVISGWRLSPIHDGKENPVRPINMDARPIFSIRLR